MPTHYPSQLNAVLRACVAYRNREIGIDELQASVWQGAEAVAAVDEAEFRRFLEDAESRLELLRFTKEDTYVAAVNVVAEMEARLRAHLA